MVRQAQVGDDNIIAQPSEATSIQSTNVLDNNETIKGMCHVRCDKNIPYSWNDRRVLETNRCKYNKIYYKFLKNKILFDNKYNWKNTIGVWRSGIILTMYLFSNHRFSFNDHCKKVFEQNIGNLNRIRTSNTDLSRLVPYLISEK